MDIKTYYNKRLIDETLDSYQSLPKELRQKTFPEIEEISDDPTLPIQSMDLAYDVGVVFGNLKELIDKGAVNFDIDDKLEDIVKLL